MIFIIDIMKNYENLFNHLSVAFTCLKDEFVIIQEFY